MAGAHFARRGDFAYHALRYDNGMVLEDRRPRDHRYDPLGFDDEGGGVAQTVASGNKKALPKQGF
jgi:hypothetical protein